MYLTETDGEVGVRVKLRQSCRVRANTAKSKS